MPMPGRASVTHCHSPGMALQPLWLGFLTSHRDTEYPELRDAAGPQEELQLINKLAVSQSPGGTTQHPS